MTSALVSNFHHFIYWMTELLQQTQGTFLIKGPWFCKMELLVTSDPINVQYIMSKRHESFNKGVNFNKIFDVLGDGIFNSDVEKWKYQRKIALCTFTSPIFRQLSARITQDKIHGGLIPILERARNEGLVIDLQDIFQSLSSDISYMVLIGHDPNALSFDPPAYSFCKGIHDAEKTILLRHILPEAVCKLQRWLKIGNERKLNEVVEAIDIFFNDVLREKREKVKKRMVESNQVDVCTNLVDLYIEQSYDTTNLGFKSPDIFLRDTFLTLLLAGQDTVTAALTWFFWLLIKHPEVEEKIREELIKHGFDERFNITQLGDSDKLVYLHAAVLETLRLYPPVPFNHKAAKHSEILPSGHEVKPWTMIILFSYGMGRMKSVWGEDCEEFKPERWITEQGTIKHEPSHKFFAFNAGPRICLGKDMSLMQIKIVVCSMLRHNFCFEMVEGHQVQPANSVVLHMKYGLNVNVLER